MQIYIIGKLLHVNGLKRYTILYLVTSFKMDNILVTLGLVVLLSTVSGELCSFPHQLAVSHDQNICQKIVGLLIIITGKPILRLDVCSESEAIFTCSVMESTTLEWDVDFLTGEDFNRVIFILIEEERAEPRDIHRLHDQNLTGVVYRFMVISLSPFMSTMTTNTSTDLSGARVSCSGRSSTPSSADGTTATLMLPGKIKNSIVKSGYS